MADPVAPASVTGRVGVVLVHYHTPELAERAVRSLLAGGGDLELEVVIVDNGSTSDGRRRLAAIDGARLLDPGANLGYAGAFNLGVRSLPAVDVLAVMNPDVEVLPGCLPALVAALSTRGVGAAGPRFWWRRRGGFQLPPTERRGRRHSLRRLLAPRTGSPSARRAWRRHARAHWLADEPLSSHALSGALLAVTADAWRHVGPFDDGYALYFEETDWLERARRAGVGGVYVPAAEALHAYAQSTAREPRAERWFAESHRRFRRRHYGGLFTAALEAVASRWREAPSSSVTSVVAIGAPERREIEAAQWLEISPSPHGFPAAGLRVETRRDGPVPLPEGDYWLRGVRGDEELFVRRLG